jgi:hypothetical protein
MSSELTRFWAEATATYSSNWLDKLGRTKEKLCGKQIEIQPAIQIQVQGVTATPNCSV